MRANVVDNKMKSVLPNNEVFSRKSSSNVKVFDKFCNHGSKSAKEAMQFTFDSSYKEHWRKFDEKTSTKKAEKEFLKYDRHS